jgi:hypothetical protein
VIKRPSFTLRRYITVQVSEGSLSRLSFLQSQTSTRTAFQKQRPLKLFSDPQPCKQTPKAKFSHSTKKEIVKKKKRKKKKRALDAQ